MERENTSEKRLSKSLSRVKTEPRKGPFLEGPGKFSHPESTVAHNCHGKIQFNTAK